MDGTRAMKAGRELQHIPVMRDAVLAGLAVCPGGRYLDGTYGRGGHARAILERLGPDGRLLVMDRDPAAIEHARHEFGADTRVAIRHANFSELGEWDATRAGLDGVLLDLGVSSPQLDDAARGFSFQSDAPLDMRMDPTTGESAADFLARADEREIADVLFRYGEERMSRRIARAIITQRAAAPIHGTRELAELVERTLGRRERNKHPATRTFQALRLKVNDELGSLERALPAATAALKPGGRLAVISFHSLEDRAVKQFIRGPQPAPARRGLPVPPVAASPLRSVGRAQMPEDEEIVQNPRARSAVLRVAERVASGAGA
ncbi:MAG: 16S rRNA (cytosine(1402)-N(4))-methyltransferase RsmH [Rhodanobacteraceae bacterium]|nr:MAG: 16S rRNA (cytosine(1402)-N(4))-methyltransferase RsmH [Rhodanobacteraceae bacterium]